MWKSELVFVGLAWVVCDGAAFAQTVTGEIAAAQQKINAKEWPAALDLLLRLRAAVIADAEREQVAALLVQVGRGFREAALFEPALRADQAALELRRKVYGDRDHEDLAASLNYVAQCLTSLGRPGEALPLYEAALEVSQRLHEGRDHPNLAASRNNVANCLLSLGRADEALPLLEAALATYQRVYGSRDHRFVAASLDNIAQCLLSLGRAAEALTRCEAALAMRERLHGSGDHTDVAKSKNDVALCLQALGRAGDALTLFEASLAMHKRLCANSDQPAVVSSLSNLASCLESLGRASEALPLFEAAVEMCKRLCGNTDHPELASGLNGMAGCLRSLGRDGEALLLYEDALAMNQRLYDHRDHPYVAAALNNLASCLQALGRDSEALPKFEAALQTYRDLYGRRDHPHVAAGLGGLALCLESLGRSAEALPQCEAALAMLERLHEDRDHPDVAGSLGNLASCFESLGRAGDALPRREAAVAMYERLYGGRDHPAVAGSLIHLASCLQSLGRANEALPRCEAALAMLKCLYGDRDHPDIAGSISNLAYCLYSLGRTGEALLQHEAALAMDKRLYGNADHPGVAAELHNVACCLQSLDRADEALLLFENSLAMVKRLYVTHDHPHVAVALSHLADCLRSLGRTEPALANCQLAAAMIERLRDESRTSSGLRQALFDDLKRGGSFELLQMLTTQLGRPEESLNAAERSRGRGLLDLLEQQQFDPLDEAERRAKQRGDEVMHGRLMTLRTDLQTTQFESSRLLHLTTQLDDTQMADSAGDVRRKQLLEESLAVNTRRRQLLDERARLLGDLLPLGRVRTTAEIQASLRERELFLEFTITEDASFLYVLARDGDVEAIELPDAFATLQPVLPELLRRFSRDQLAESRGLKPRPEAAGETPAVATAHELFSRLIPQVLWPRLRAADRVFLSPHRSLHRLPFELLVTDVHDGEPVFWLDSGPAIAYVPSGTTLHWLRQRARDASDAVTRLDLLAVGDPHGFEAEPEVPEHGVFVVSVNEGSEGARVGLLPGDVLISYDAKLLLDDTTLRDLRMAAEVAIEDGVRPDTPIAARVWRRGAVLAIELAKGLLGIQVGRGRARLAYEASLGPAAQMERITRAGSLERLRKLPPLRGARAETAAIEGVFAASGGMSRHLLGQDATEPAVFDLAAQAKYLHFACHGLAEEYAGQSLSMLVLSQPQNVLPGDDGLLELDDLLQRWRGRLTACRLVVLSACRTNVGPTLRDEAPQALPIGFLFAGASSVISSLWAVDDASTRELMTDFYGRLRSGETDRLKAFTAAKKALRYRHPDPYHWAPFLYMGCPE